MPTRVKSQPNATQETAEKNTDNLHGNIAHQAHVALLLIDVINDLEFPEGEQIYDSAIQMARKIAGLKKRANAAKIPVVYVNDNFGIWQSDFRSVVQHCLEDDVRGKPLTQMLAPDDDDYFVLKPKHSGFYSTTLDNPSCYLQA